MGYFAVLGQFCTKLITYSAFTHTENAPVKIRGRFEINFITKSQPQYRKIPIVSPGLIFVQKTLLLCLFSEGLIIGRNFAFQNGFGLTLKTASINSPWAFIWEGLL